jgi:hypothetical protein
MRAGPDGSLGSGGVFPHALFETEGRSGMLIAHAVVDVSLAMVAGESALLCLFARTHSHVEVAVHRVLQVIALGINTNQVLLSRSFPVAPKQRDKSKSSTA